MAETDDNKDNQNQTEEDKPSSNQEDVKVENASESDIDCLLYTSPSPRD